MSHIESFDNLDDMFAKMGEMEDEANARLTPGQIRLRDDLTRITYWVRAIPDWDLVVYGRAETVDVLRSAGVSFDPIENRARGYLTGTAFSATEPTGEFGDTHVADVVPINALVFEAARYHGWPTWSMLHEDEYRILAQSLAIAERKSLGR